ncbi:MAG: ribonuclease P protein component [Actinomycetota bacterium]|nr:ribonuclease P protein component [Actinomycetota bacterium]
MRRENRLTAPKDFSRIYQTGKRFRTNSVTAVGIIDDTRAPRIGITSSKRIGNAVARNRARRRLRAAATGVVPSLRPGATAVLQASPAALSSSWEKLETDVRRALAGVGLSDG